jgi:hypothetical protein
MPPRENWTSDRTNVLKKLVKMRLYTTERIKTWLENEKDLNEKAPYEVTITTYDAEGQEHKIVAKGPNKRVVFCSYHQVVGHGYGEPRVLWNEPEQFADPGFEGMLVRVTDALPTPIPAECCDVASRLELMDVYIKKWEETEFCKDLMAHVETWAHIMTDVKNMVCFGLGTLQLDPDKPFGNHADQNLLQHHAAVKIRDMIAQKQNKKPEEIPIFAQDPCYCEKCKWLLKNKFGKPGIEIVKSNSGYLKVDGNTFVVSVCPTAPVRQIIGDITFDKGGPAGMLCNIMQGEGHQAAETVVDFESEPLYLGFFMSTTKKGLHREWVNKPDEDDPTEGKSDANQTVEIGNKIVPGCVFGPIACYGKPK